jgi:adenylate cyclase class IV
MTTSDKVVEVEVTGPVTSADATRLQATFSTWQFEGRFDRYLINFTNDALRAQRIDLRARITNGQPEMVVKHGEWGSGKRVETLVHTQPGEFMELVTAVTGLGFLNAIGGRRIITRYTKDEMELSLIEVPNYSMFYEAERMVPLGSEDGVFRELEEWAQAEGLKVFSKDEYLAFIADLDANANDVLDFRSPEAWDTVRRQISTIG